MRNPMQKYYLGQNIIAENVPYVGTKERTIVSTALTS